MKAIIPLAVLAALGGCTTIVPGPIVEGPVRQDGRAAIDQPTRVGELILTPKRVVEDSRCPINVRCVWAGRVVLETRIDGAGWRETVHLELGKPHFTRGAGVALVGVSPDKMAGEPALPAPYLFTFERR